MKINIIAGGHINRNQLPEINKNDFIIGVDRGAYWLINNNTIPQIAIGDFDSVTEKELNVIKQKVSDVRIFPKDKDQTDLELAIEVAKLLKPKEVMIYGALGGRADHMLANILLLEKFEKAGIGGKILDEKNEILLCSTRRTIYKDKKYKYISVIPLSDKANVTLKGLLYSVTGLIINRGQTIGVSNEIKAKKAEITVHKGKILIIKSHYA